MLSAGRAKVEAVGARIKDARPRGFVIAARGSSDNAALYAKYLFGRRNRSLVSLATPSLFTHYASPPRLEGQCVIGISQSGSSPDVIAVIEEAARQGALTLALTNDPESKLAGVAELVLALGAGPERSVPASKTYTASLLALALLSQVIDLQPAFETALAEVPHAMADALGRETELDRLAPALLGPRAIVLARGFNLATAEEVALSSLRQATCWPAHGRSPTLRTARSPWWTRTFLFCSSVAAAQRPQTSRRSPVGWTATVAG